VDSRTVTCTHCLLSKHMACLDPVMKRKPRGSWFCSPECRTFFHQLAEEMQSNSSSVVTKKRRGRPRKHPLPEQIQVAEGKERTISQVSLLNPQGKEQSWEASPKLTQTKNTRKKSATRNPKLSKSGDNDDVFVPELSIEDGKEQAVSQLSTSMPKLAEKIGKPAKSNKTRKKSTPKEKKDSNSGDDDAEFVPDASFYEESEDNSDEGTEFEEEEAFVDMEEFGEVKARAMKKRKRASSPRKKAYVVRLETIGDVERRARKKRCSGFETVVPDVIVTEENGERADSDSQKLVIALDQLSLKEYNVTCQQILSIARLRASDLNRSLEWARDELNSIMSYERRFRVSEVSIENDMALKESLTKYIAQLLGDMISQIEKAFEKHDVSIPDLCRKLDIAEEDILKFFQLDLSLFSTVQFLQRFHPAVSSSHFHPNMLLLSVDLQLAEERNSLSLPAQVCIREAIDFFSQVFSLKRYCVSSLSDVIYCSLSSAIAAKEHDPTFAPYLFSWLLCVERYLFKRLNRCLSESESSGFRNLISQVSELPQDDLESFLRLEMEFSDRLETWKKILLDSDCISKMDVLLTVTTKTKRIRKKSAVMELPEAEMPCVTPIVPASNFVHSAAFYGSRAQFKEVFSSDLVQNLYEMGGLTEILYDKDHFSLSLFSSIKAEDNPLDILANAGEYVSSMSWCPVGDEHSLRSSCTGLLALSCIPRSIDVDASTCQSGFSIIQFWKFLPQHRNFEIAFFLLHHTGFIWSLAWCPSGAWQPFEQTSSEIFSRIGILAAAFGDGTVSLFNIPHPEYIQPFALCQFLPAVTIRFPNPSDSPYHLIDWKIPSLLIIGSNAGVVSVVELTSDLVFGSIVSPKFSFQASNPLATITALTCNVLHPHLIAVINSVGTLSLWDLDYLDSPIASHELWKPCHFIEFAPFSDHIIFAGLESGFKIVDLETLETTRPAALGSLKIDEIPTSACYVDHDRLKVAVGFENGISCIQPIFHKRHSREKFRVFSCASEVPLEDQHVAVEFRSSKVLQMEDSRLKIYDRELKNVYPAVYSYYPSCNLTKVTCIELYSFGSDYLCATAHSGGLLRLQHLSTDFESL